MGPGPPEYSDFAWFALILSSSAGTGLFFYGTKEPLFFYTAPNKYCNQAVLNAQALIKMFQFRLTRNPFKTDNQLAQEAMTMSFYHWGTVWRF